MKGFWARKRRNIKLIKRNNEKRINNIHKEKFLKVSKIVPPSVNYNRIKYKNHIYNINDCLLIKDPLVPEGYLIARLLEIIPTNGIEKYPYWPAIKVQWYFN